MTFKLYKGMVELLIPFYYMVGAMPVKIPTGFRSDGLSIPRFVYALKMPFLNLPFPFDPRYLEEAVKHDFCYKTGAIPRKRADIELRKGLREAGAGMMASQIIYLAVRMFGKFNYNKGDKNELV